VTFKVHNIGSAEATCFDWVYYWADPGPNPYCEESTCVTLGAGADALVSWQAGPIYASYTTYVIVDAGRTVVESDESNNRSYFQISVH
jgi:subtilase family serine protease